MESRTESADYKPSTSQRVLSAAIPVLWVAVSYVDPGKWATAVEGGARLGCDIALLMLVMNLVAVLCQYLSARIPIATGKDLAQICREEYDGITCVLLGIQAATSMIVLDLTMVLGTAYGLNAVFGIDLFNSVLLTGLDAVLSPLVAGLLENPKAKFFSKCLASFALVSYICGVLISHRESSVSMGGILNKLSGENAYALMSLLGANIMPHNFYLHSSIVQQDQGHTNVSKRAMCHDHFFATLCIFSGIFLANCTLMNLAASVFYNDGIVGLTSQEGLSLLEQAPWASAALVLLVFSSNQLMSLPWSRGGRLMVHDFFRLDIPCWLHRATIRIVAIIPALYCVWHSGGEGIFQLLVGTQVVVALLLPSSVIPLFQVASSRSIMGSLRISHLEIFLALISFVGMLGLNVFFVIEMIFGSSDWVSNLKWNSGSSVPFLYAILQIAALVSLCLMIWLVITPLKPASSEVDTEPLQWKKKADMRESVVERDSIEVNEGQYQFDKSLGKLEPSLSLDKSFENHQNLSISGPDVDLPETLSDSESNLELTTIQENKSEFAFSEPAIANPEAIISEVTLPESVKVIRSETPDTSTLSTGPEGIAGRMMTIEGDVQNEKDDDGDSWEPEESTKDMSKNDQNLTSEGSGSFRSLSGRNDDVGSGAGSLSRLAGLGRAARRQLTVILDEFWGQLFDFHGQLTQDAKTKKLDNLLGLDSKVDLKSSTASAKLDNLNKESTGYFSSTGGRGSDSLRTSGFYNASMQQIGQSTVGSPLGMQQGSSMWANQKQLFARNSSNNALDSGEKRYYSMHIPSSSDAYDQQPATIHGYELTSYLSRIAQEKGSDYLKGQLEALTKSSTPTIQPNSLDSYSRSSVQKPQNGLRFSKPPGFHNVPVSRNSSLKFEKPLDGLSSPEPVDYSINSGNVKKFYSMPNVSGLYKPHRDSSLTGSSTQWENSAGYGQSISQQPRELMSLSASSRSGTALGYNDLSPSNRGAFSLQYGSNPGPASLWSRQPYEQFGVASKSPPIQETAPTVDMEAKLLQSFRSCIMKLLKLEGSEWLFKQNDGADEDLIDRVAARERFLYEIEARALDRKFSSAPNEADNLKILSFPNCGDGCVWRLDLIISFGVWCIHRILDLSLMESRPELWGKYTYVLNRLQGIVDLAFSKPRSPKVPCFCLQLPVGYQQKSSPPPISHGSLPPPAKQARGKFTTAPMLLEIVKDVEIAISCRKGRTGTAAGDVAFPKGKENLASVLKRYKRRLSNKPVGCQEVGQGSARKIVVPPLQGL